MVVCLKCGHNRRTELTFTVDYNDPFQKLTTKQLKIYTHTYGIGSQNEHNEKCYSIV